MNLFMSKGLFIKFCLYLFYNYVINFRFNSEVLYVGMGEGLRGWSCGKVICGESMGIG